MFDLNDNGVNDFKELSMWLLDEIKDLVDTDDDGKVELEEVIVALAKAGYTITKAVK